MPRPVPPRLHRLPQWTDQILIPAPSDLSLTDVAGKSPLPTIIVTPSSPSSNRDFSLAFLPSQPKPSFRDRLQTYKSPYTPNLRVRSILCAFLCLLLICQLLAHRLAARYPRLEMASSAEADAPSGKHVPPAHQSLLDWFNVWPKEGEYVPEFVPFDHDVGSWLD